MKAILFLIATLMIQPTPTLFNFNKDSSLSNWRVVDDGVMGGLSQGNFELTQEGHGRFFGTVRLENNGGFSSVRYNFEPVAVSNFTKVCIRLKGDAKSYQFRVKDKSGNYFSYIAPFDTSGAWQTIEIALSDMYPSFRGRTLEMPNFSEEKIEELVFLIGNKTKEDFELLIDSIELK